MIARPISKRPEIFEVRALCLSLLFVGCLVAPLTGPGQWVLGQFFTQRTHCGPSAAASLKTLTVAQVDFRANDRDGNGINDFWRGDVAGLYGICPTGTAEMIRLLEISVAGADLAALNPGSTPPAPGAMTGQTYYATRGPKAGYWFTALRHADEKTPDPKRFAFCCFPAQYGKSGRWTFIVDESNRIYKKDLGRAGGVAAYPADPVAEGWAPID